MAAVIQSIHGMVSESSARALARLTGQTPEPADRWAPPKAASPTIALVRGPANDIPDLVADVMDALDSDHPGGRRVSRALRRRRSRLLGADADGHPTMDGRRCCYDVALWLNQRAGQIKPEEFFRCRVCGAVWTVINLVREERLHGR